MYLKCLYYVFQAVYYCCKLALIQILPLKLLAQKVEIIGPRLVCTAVRLWCCIVVISVFYCNYIFCGWVSVVVH